MTSSDQAIAPPEDSSRRYLLILAVIAGSVLVVDQAAKWWAVQTLPGRGAIEILGPLLSLRYVRNPGAAFGMGSGLTVVLTAIALVVVVVILRTARHLRSTGWAVGLALLLGGALGNLLDRIFRSPGPFRGEVVDFLALPNFPVFNVADMAIVSAACILGALSLTGRRYDGTRETDAPPAATTHGPGGPGSDDQRP